MYAIDSSRTCPYACPVLLCLLPILTYKYNGYRCSNLGGLVAVVVPDRFSPKSVDRIVASVCSMQGEMQQVRNNQLNG